MASRAEASAAVPRPHVGAIRAALTDFYFDSLRLVRANLVWGAAVVLVVILAIGWPLFGIVSMPLLALPTAGVFRTAARIVRADHDPTKGDLRWAYGRAAGRLLIVGVGFVATALVCGWNVGAGLVTGGAPGWLFASLAAWGLVATWCVALVLWPILADPQRPDRPLRDGLRVTVQVLLTQPRPVAGLAATVALLVVVSLVLTVAVLTVSVAFVALIACRSIYPIVDRLDERDALSVGPTG